MTKLDIHVLPNGPIKVAHAASVTFCGEPLDTDGDIYLCRCGKSGNAPFCDGSHNEGFDGSRQKEPTKAVHAWEGKTITTYFNPNACMHVFACKPLKELRARELAGDASAADEIMKVVGACPSGALTYATRDGQAGPGACEGPACIDIQEGGEIRIQRDYTINAEPMERMPSGRATLCRCGLSKNKPWCDGAHVKAKDFR